MVTREELLRCSISNWYSQYEKHTFPTILVPLPEEFVSWLLEDGLFLPASNSAFPTRNKQDTILAEDDYQDWSTSEDDEQHDTSAPNFPDLLDSINTGIAQLGGHVVPKCTWSVPKDATWVAVGNTLKCNTADQVLLLLKSSDRVAHDLEEALAQCTNDTRLENNDDGNDKKLKNNITTGDISHTSGGPTNTHSTPPGGHILALRKWYDLKSGREFRCFVVDGKLKGISQRDVSRRYEELESEFESIKTRIEQFHQLLINNSNTNFTYDCYVPSAVGSAVKIIDFNPAGGTTAPLLFEWEEILKGTCVEKIKKEGKAPPEAMEDDSDEDDDQVEFRIIREDVVMRPDTALYGVPYDFVDYSEGSALRALMENAQRGNGADEKEE